ncbi:MAG: hypothetical protein ISP42_05975 [Alphaproteobacteria bacterium]|jgi:hypothetical protein|nr:hypothetical protein [Alphaproteobacteria bacterium]
MAIKSLDFAAPFFGVDYVKDSPALDISRRAIVLNLAEEPLLVEQQQLGPLQSAILSQVQIRSVTEALIVTGFDDYEDEEALFEQVRQHWPSAFAVRGEERLRGIEHYMSPKIWLGTLGLTMYHSASVPLNVGLHREHAFCPVPGFREVHTQIVGIGKMQQCHERDVKTLYLEETMAPGTTHRPMYDAQGNFPWHQYETITPSIFMAVEMLPDGAEPPQPG